jgi:hypothetical protein
MNKNKGKIKPELYDGKEEKVFRKV